METVSISGPCKMKMRGWPFAFVSKTEVIAQATRPIIVKGVHIGPIAFVWISRG